MAAKTWLILAISLSLAGFAGCGAKVEESAPGTALPVGSKVLLIADDVNFDGQPETSVPVTTYGQGFTLKIVEGGTQATVVRDPGGIDPERPVMVHVVEGKLSGITGTAARKDCRPVK